MDKYTVDLDQVLNDFEYSELATEQQSKLPKKSNNSYYLTSNKNSNVKHSINNVFHSLNEYLNTEITPKSTVQAPNIDCLDKTDFINDKPECSNNNTNESAIKFYDNFQKKHVDETDFNRHHVNRNVFVNNFVQNDFKLLEKNTNFNNKTTERKLANNDKINNKDNKKVHENPVKEETLIVQTNDNLENQGTEEKQTELEEQTESNLKQPPELVQKYAESEEITQDVTDKDKTAPTEAEPEIVENTTQQNPENKIGNLEEFTENSESRLCENEAEAPNVNSEAEAIEVQVTEINENIEKVQGAQVEKDTPEPPEEVEQETNPLELMQPEIQSDVETIVDDLPKCDVIMQHKIQSEAKMTECDVIDRTDKPVGFESNVEIDESELNEYLNNIEKECDIEEQQIERPCNLSLKDVVTQEENRQINLIGEPGSTPFNNVYITKELQPTTEQTNKHESETDCSSTSSPTFSETSIETTSSDLNDIQAVATVAKDVDTVANVNVTAVAPSVDWLGKQAPLWLPDNEALHCLHCEQKFTVIKRRHHCRACGLVLCSKCCNLKMFLDYLEGEARVCHKCSEILRRRNEEGELCVTDRLQPNPNNPLEYCSTVPPHQQINPDLNAAPSVLVPVGVLKRQGSNKTRTASKSVMFCDGIRPGSDLTNLDNDFTFKTNNVEALMNKQFPNFNEETKSFIPNCEEDLPPIVEIVKTDWIYTECKNNLELIEKLKNDTIGFALQLNLIVYVKLVNLDCCVNKTCWCFTTNGLINVGQDEIIYLIEIINNNELIPKEIFSHINNIYLDALKGNSIKEMGITLHNTSNFLDSNKHSGFIYIKPTFQCLQNIQKPTEPYLIGILIHKWETPWAKLFPLRLVLRLGAEYRYYPSPIISTRFRDSVFVEIGHTIINLLADFRNFSYTLPQIRGLTIHMEDKNTIVTIPMNRYDQIMKSINNSSDHILAFAGNFSMKADSHLVCIQDTQGNDNSYSTHAINILNKTRKVTGASFIVFNGALKSSSGLTAKSSIVEDGLMVQIPSEHMLEIRENLRNMKNHTINCGCINADCADETVNIVWGENDIHFNLDILSPIDNKSMNGVPSIRVHNGKDFITHNRNRLIRWTEVFIIQNGDESSSVHNHQDPIDVSKVSESIAKATCAALVKYLDLLVSNNFYKIGIRVTLHIDNVSYLAGGNNVILPPIYMKRLDNELIPILHRLTTTNHFFNDNNSIVLELVFRILNN